MTTTTTTTTVRAALGWAVGIVAAAFLGLLLAAWQSAPAPAAPAAPAPAASASAPAAPTAPASPAAREAMRQANLTCDAVAEEVQYEFCVVGAYALGTGVALGVDGYSYDDQGFVVLT